MTTQPQPLTPPPPTQTTTTGQAGADTAVGYLLLAMYLTCDSFTSQWQDKVFKKFQAG